MFSRRDGAASTQAYPDTLVGTDSHTTMINGLGVLGWGVGGIEAEAAMLGQPVTMLIPQVIGFKLTGSLPAGTTATDLVLTVTEMLRKKGVVDKFVEFFGDGLSESAAGRPRHHRQHVAGIRSAPAPSSPSMRRPSAISKLTGRPAEQIALVEAYAKAQGLWRINGAAAADYTDVLELDLSTVEPSLAGPEAAAGPRAAAQGQERLSRQRSRSMAEERTQKNPSATRQRRSHASAAQPSR